MSASSLSYRSYGGLYSAPVVIDPTSQLMTNAWSEMFLNGMITTCKDILTVNGKVRDKNLGARVVRDRVSRLYDIMGSASQGFRLQQPFSKSSFLAVGDRLIDHCAKHPNDNAITAALSLMNGGAGGLLKPNNNRSDIFDSPRKYISRNYAFNGNNGNVAPADRFVSRTQSSNTRNNSTSNSQSSDIWNNTGNTLPSDSWSGNGTNAQKQSGPLVLE